MSLKKFYWKSLGTFIFLNLSLIYSEAQENSQIDPIPEVTPSSAVPASTTKADSKINSSPNPSPSLIPADSTASTLASQASTPSSPTPNTNLSSDPTPNLSPTQSPSLPANPTPTVGSTSTLPQTRSPNTLTRGNLANSPSSSMSPSLQPATTQQILELNEKIKSIEARMAMMGEKLNQTLDTKLATLSEKLTSTQTTLNEVIRQNSIPIGEVFSSPADSVGKPVAQNSIRLDSQDPELGYIQDEGMEKLRDGLILFQSKKYPESVLRFSDFISRNPDHLLAGTAQYYIGSAYLQQKEYQLALDELQKVIRSYSRSTHISDALKDIATVQGYLKKEKEMTRTEQALNSTFPQSPAARTNSLESSIASTSNSMESKTLESQPVKSPTVASQMNPPSMTASKGVSAPNTASQNSTLTKAPGDKKTPSQFSTGPNSQPVSRAIPSRGSAPTSASPIAPQASSSLTQSEIKKPLTSSSSTPKILTQPQNTKPVSQIKLPTAPIYSSSTGDMD